MLEIVLRDGQCFLNGNTTLGGFPTPWAALRASELLAMDEAPNRTIDRDGRMHVQTSRISKSNICEYFGREIPKCRELGLDPGKKYKLLRDPDELKKGASSFNNLPILAQHVPVTAMDHKPHLIIGTTGTDARFEEPYLTNSTSFWSGGAVGAIQGKKIQDLSSAYHFRADMTPGEYEGEAYDGVMRDIVGNHVALVPKGRAGDDIIVGDSQPTENLMSHKVLSRTALFAAGATSALIATALAMDAAPIDTSALFEDVTSKNFKEMKPKVLERTREALKGVVLAQDASIEDVVKLVDALEQPQVQEGADANPETGAPMDAGELKASMTTDPNAGVPGAAPVVKDGEGGEEDLAANKRREFLAGKLSPEDLQAYDALCGNPAAMDEEEDEDEMKIDKPAMDAAINSALEAQRTRLKATRQAEIAVEPFVGKLTMAFDSAEQVHRKALDILGVSHSGLHPDALLSIIQAQPKPGARPAPAVIAMDSAAVDGFHGRFKNAARIGHA